ncbi:MAG: extracellular solute-binding protein [Clostridiaceae bacterium]|nr:extracellular solute-binding protein [Clostridiaceae bacterium]
MKRTTKILALVLASLMIVTLFAGCSGSAETTATTASSGGSTTTAGTSSSGSDTTGTNANSDMSYLKDTSPIEITDWYRGRWWDGVIDEGDGWTDSAIYSHIKDMTGVSFNYEVPAASEDEAIGPMIASGTYPDMITFGSYNSPYIAQMKDAGLIYSLTDLSKQYAPELYDQDLITKSMRAFFQDENDQLWFYVGFEGNDASIDAYLSIDFVPTSGANVLYVRKDLLKAWGKNDLTSWADLNDLLSFIAKNYDDVDPIRLDTGNQIDGVFGRHFLSAFGCHLSRTAVDTNSKQLKYIMKDEHAVNYFKWLNELYNKGVITDTMIADSTDIRDEKLHAGKYGILISSSFEAANTINTIIKENDGNSDRAYVALSQVSYDDQKYFQAETIKSKGGSATVITKNCAKPDRAIRLLEYFLTEDGQVTGTLGVEGTTWEWKDGKRVLMEEPAKLISSNLTEYCAKYKCLGAFTQFASQVYWAYYCDDFLTPTGYLREENNALLGPYLTELWNYGFIDIRNSLKTGSDVEVISTQLGELQGNYTSKMIAAKSNTEFDGYLTALLSDAEGIGLEKLEKQYTDEYLKNCEALGVTPWETLYKSIPIEKDVVLQR